MKLYYVHDPMCSWCWAFRPVWTEIVQALPRRVIAERLLGGLAPDSELPMPESMRAYIETTWRKIQEVAPGTPFNYEFWSRCKPRRSTYPACRAVIAAMRQGSEYEEPMIVAIQEAYYLHAQNPSDDETLIQLASAIGLDKRRFIMVDLNSAETRMELLKQIALSKKFGTLGFPSLILCENNTYRTLTYDYHNPGLVLDQLDG